ncbi:MAG: hypothetical protein PHG32_08820, partial [Candidatus Cloacimonetes bacterium]|nr:hypothetical protein [Candidatus Cloacimonadota bacterium]
SIGCSEPSSNISTVLLPDPIIRSSVACSVILVLLGLLELLLGYPTVNLWDNCTPLVTVVKSFPLNMIKKLKVL